jgi:hypothetical protein
MEFPLQCRCVHIKVHCKTFHPFPSSIFSLNLSPIQSLIKRSPEYGPWNVLYHTSLRNYASFSLQVPSDLSILLDQNPNLSCLAVLLYRQYFTKLCEVEV